MKETQFFETIKKEVLSIDSDLNSINKTGIYFAPEHYIAFRLGRAIYLNREIIFGIKEIEWLREIKLGNGGPSDIVFKDTNVISVIELKLRKTYYSYKLDIEKLKRLDGNYNRYFCVLLDSFSENNDDRLRKLELEFKGLLFNIGHHSFKTWNNWYENQIFCNLNLYSIK